MSDVHEKFIAQLIDGNVQPGSGNQWHRQTDVRNDRRTPFAMAADGKSTFAQSASVSIATWRKLVEQSHDLIPILPLRFYETQRLAVGLDLVVIGAGDFGRILDTARAYDENGS